MSPNDEMIVDWKHDWLPNLMGSEIRKWMLENNLTEYYSQQMNKDLREAAQPVSRIDSTDLPLRGFAF
jgi:hypothetical protein